MSNNPISFGFETEVLPAGSKLELFLGTFIGAMTWSGSVIAFLKLSGRMSGTPIVFSGQHMLNLVLAIVMIGFGLWFFFSETTNWTAFIAMTAIAFLLGFLIIIPIGGFLMLLQFSRQIWYDIVKWRVLQHEQ